jgi:hypothetical protein
MTATKEIIERLNQIPSKVACFKSFYFDFHGENRFVLEQNCSLATKRKKWGSAQLIVNSDFLQSNCERIP